MRADDPKRLDLASLDISDGWRRELLRLFPEIRTEGGTIDLERLKLALGESVDVVRERYGMAWPGSADRFRAIHAASQATLRPAPLRRPRESGSRRDVAEKDHIIGRLVRGVGSGAGVSCPQ